MLDRIAAIQHEIWSNWMKHLFEVSIQNEDGSVTIPASRVNRWKRQMQTNYADLSDSERDSDIEQAIKVIAEIDRSNKV